MCIRDSVTTALIKLGLDRKDITTENFNVYPNYVWKNGERKQEGYKASHRIRVQLKDDKMDDVGEVIDAGVDNGAGISYINFELSQDLQNKYKKQALEQATKDARSKAEGIASGLGKKLGRVISITSQEFNYYPWRVYEAVGEASIKEAKSAVTEIQPGEQEISGRVSIVYALR